MEIFNSRFLGEVAFFTGNEKCPICCIKGKRVDNIIIPESLNKPEFVKDLLNYLKDLNNGSILIIRKWNNAQLSKTGEILSRYQTLKENIKN